MTHQPNALPPEVAAALQQLDHLIQMFSQHPDEAVQEAVVALLRAVDVLHRGALKRLGAYLDARSLLDDVLAEPHVALLFDLYESDENADQRARAEAAVAVIRPDVEALGGRIEIVATEGGAVNVRLLGAGDHRSGSTESLRRLVEEALQAELPDLVRLDVSPPATQSRGPEPASGVFIPLSSVKRRTRVEPAQVDGGKGGNPGSTSG